MKILFVAAEASPLVKVGELADVVGSLPKELIKLGHDVRVMLPKYKTIKYRKDKLSLLFNNLSIDLPGSHLTFNVFGSDESTGIRYYLIDNRQQFGGEEIYGEGELKRFLFFNKAAVKAMLKLNWKPDIVHCHDWHTAFIPKWLKDAGWKGSTLFTIHNLNYQGFFDEAVMSEFGLRSDWEKVPDTVPCLR